MKIDSSIIAMGSTRTHQKTSMVAISTSMKKTQPKTSEKDKDGTNSSPQSMLLREKIRTLEEENSPLGGIVPDPQDIVSDPKIKMLERMLELLRMTVRGTSASDKEARPLPDIFAFLSNNNSPVLNLASGNSPMNSVWTREIKMSSFTAESEQTTFSTTGMVRTEDGKEISFQLDLEMSRSFMEYNEFISEETVQILTDPLVINLDNSTASVTDQKFLFDLDADGTMDNISFVGSGSGFLSLDKNNDGKINDGSELFGTKSGNGFADLAEYDKDKNGWIDENDEVFSKLKIWTKDKEGNDRLIGLAEAGVGAIYLGNVSTDFSLTNDKNTKNAQVRKTGVYLKESGQAGTVQHIDIAM